MAPEMTGSDIEITKRYRLLYREPDGDATYESVGGPDYELLTISKDGSVSREVWGMDLAGIREHWEATSPYSKVLVPDDAGRKVWTQLDAPEPAPQTATAPETAPDLQDEVRTSAQVPEAEPQVGPPAPAPSAPPVPEVSPDVEQTARAIALKVWSTRGLRYGFLTTDLRLREADVDGYLDYAVAMQWVQLDGEFIRPGAVNPNPIESLTLPDERNSRGWKPWRLHHG